MKLGFLGLGLALSASAHTLFTTLFINGENQGDGTCVRMPRDGATANGPVHPITGNDMACGRDGAKAVAFTCPTPHRATLTFEFRMHPDGREPGPIAASHKGPCAVYLKRVDDMYAADDVAAGPGWFKIWQDGYSNETGKWCVDRLIENHGFLSVRLPAVPTGYYLVRPEILALHNAARGDAEFYTGCAQIYVEQGPDGALEVPPGKDARIPGHVSPDDGGVRFDVHARPLPAYVVPGPGVFAPKGQGQGQGAPTRRAKQTAGKRPGDCVLKNANWCARPVPGFSDARGCWTSAQNCYDQGERCWRTAPPSGNVNCKTWQDYCGSLEATCTSAAASGPPQFRGGEETAALPEKAAKPWNDVFSRSPRIRRPSSEA
ncbi:hypothetical protein UVI_02019070 [Ustilaginoidea virens]|uniref:lytic cellulose monooxygenase (C4-dehydrogenating) n=1 Tax=Ustilaginoidea virens TaxID=1159556 RepID=A0A1B5KX95_USTVR|nr:hypothetical protein UVI_02019070 [Ustilaginoidea virens]